MGNMTQAFSESKFLNETQLNQINENNNKNDLHFGDVLSNFEAEHLIEKLRIINIEEYGSNEWFKQDEIYQRLNMQAHVNALMKSDEFIMDTMVTFDKLKILIFDLVQTELWKQKVLPLIKNHLLITNTYRNYIAIYHESVICNLLEVVMYHRTAIDSAEEYLVELIDYCYRKLLNLANYQKKKITKKSVEEMLAKTREQEFNEQIEDIEFKIGMMCISIIRFITDYVQYLPIGTLHHLLEVTDILCVFVPLIENKPWLRQNHNDEREKYENSKWVIVEKNEYSKIIKIEANVWIAIYNLFMSADCRKKYELNEFRKSNLLRLRKYMNEILMDQIPNLSHMLRSLEELSIIQVQSIAQNNPFIVQQIPEIREKISKGKNWKDIAEKQKQQYFIYDIEQAKEDMKRLADLYGQNIVEGLLEGFKCEQCKKMLLKDVLHVKVFGIVQENVNYQQNQEVEKVYKVQEIFQQKEDLNDLD
ncbi:zinc mynd domain protein 10 [Ichthyophthirius multifiliis]|uniref:Zinc mynd domain protein 10 n=1 Tax=Ichthyophthirius multifiliis TaxID=5932 RepID=G0R1W8_ICHMU|nr:zinc mynd domain protein 10 [Ichthyophthirius multifiliis]EGR28541.1 zinc mynd domain protein 10 [Ichthyophthirius multifiliis]|eukprot:XP_004029777.1 zinc mynd domain protein 10 [Ichthyophthirius multifiliis]